MYANTVAYTGQVAFYKIPEQHSHVYLVGLYRRLDLIILSKDNTVLSLYLSYYIQRSHSLDFHSFFFYTPTLYCENNHFISRVSV